MVDIAVLVPNEEGVAALADVPGINPLRYDPAGELPPGADEAQVLIPGFGATAETIALVPRLPKLRMVQLLSAGAEAWIGRLPAGVDLSDCRGAHGGATAEWIVAALLSVYRHLPRFLRARDAARWDAHRTEELAASGLLLTPHVGGGVPAALGRAYAIAAEQLTLFACGQRPPNLVQNGY